MEIIAQVDLWGIYVVSHAEHPFFHALFIAASLLFEPLVLACFFVLIIAYAHGKHKDTVAVAYAGAVFGTFAIAAFLKNSIARSRPDIGLYEFTTLFEPAFPSAHAMVSFVTAVLGAYLVTRCMRRGLVFYSVWIASSMLIVLVGMSRVYLGVHWTSDVLGGWFFGSVILYAIFVHIKRWDKVCKEQTTQTSYIVHSSGYN